MAMMPITAPYRYFVYQSIPYALCKLQNRLYRYPCFKNYVPSLTYPLS